MEHGRSNHGLTLIELMVALGVASVVMGLIMYSIKSMKNPLANATFAVEQFVQLARSRAISGTQVVEVRPGSSTQLIASKSNSCSGTMTTIQEMTVDLPQGTSFNNINTSVCFNARGLANSSVSFQIDGPNGQTKTVQIALGGGTNITR